MKLLFIAAMTAVATAAPSKRGQSNIPVEATIPSSFPAVQDGATPYVSGAGEKVKRGKGTNEGIVARAAQATLTVDIWMDRDRGGRHEGLITDTQRCYNLGNGWNDQISSLSVPNGFGCIFYRNNDCNNNDSRLTVPGGNYIANLQSYDFNDMISSYLCYN